MRIKKSHRLANEEAGFTLAEMLVALVVVGILLAIAIPSYLGFGKRANDSTARANLRSALPAVEAYTLEYRGYGSMTTDALRSTDAGIAAG